MEVIPAQPVLSPLRGSGNDFTPVTFSRGSRPWLITVAPFGGGKLPCQTDTYPPCKNFVELVPGSGHGCWRSARRDPRCCPRYVHLIGSRRGAMRRRAPGWAGRFERSLVGSGRPRRESG